MRILDKYRPETRAEKRARLRQRAQARAEGKDDEPTKRPPVVHQGVDAVTKLVEAKKAQLVVIAHDVNPVEVRISLLSCEVESCLQLVIFLPALCRKMGVPYCIIKGKARLGRLCHRKTTAAVCLANVNP